jgi:hypothetical protein
LLVGLGRYELDKPNGIVPNPTRTAFRDLPRARLHGYVII